MKYLFVGGYAHGTVREVPDGYDTWKVPVPRERFFYAASDDIRVDDTRVDRYERSRGSFGGLPMTTYVLPGHESWFAHALLTAAGLR